MIEEKTEVPNVIGNLIKLRDAHPYNTPAWHRLVETIHAIRALKSEPDAGRRSLLRQSINDHMGWLERRGE